MKIQKHDGVVVDAAGSRQGFAKRKRGGEVLRREREAPGAVVRLPSLPPPIYRPPGGGRRPWEMQSPRGAAAKGWLPPQAKWGAPPPLGFPTLGAGEAQGGAHQPTRGWFPSHFSPWGPPG